MIKNIPNKYTSVSISPCQIIEHITDSEAKTCLQKEKEMLKESIDATHAKTYDFLYLRMDYENKCNHGYAFINFIDYRYLFSNFLLMQTHLQNTCSSVISFAEERVGRRWYVSLRHIYIVMGIYQS